MTLDELARAIRAILPRATFGEDKNGQIVVYTNFQRPDMIADFGVNEVQLKETAKSNK